MQVALFTDTDFDTASGAATALRALLAHAPADVRPRVYSFGDLEVDEPAFATLRPASVLRLDRLGERLREQGVGVIHVAGGGLTVAAGRYLAERARLPLVGSVWGSGSRSIVERWVDRGCARVMVPSAAAARAAERDGRGWRTLIWPAGTDPVRFSPARRSSRLREDWHVSDRRPAILVAGCLAGAHASILVDRLSTELHRQHVAHRLIVLGGGASRAAIQRDCPDVLVTGWLPNDQAAIVMASADLLVYPSARDTGCSALLEAQACGLPALVGHAGSARENVVPGVTGYICRAGDVRELASRAGAILADRGHRLAMGCAAREYAAKRSWPVSLEPVYSLYREAAGSKLAPLPSATDTPRASAARRLAAMLSMPLRHRRRVGAR